MTSTTTPGAPEANTAMMTAVVLDRANGPFRKAEIARPEAGENQVLVRIQASGVNPLDAKIRAGVAAHAKHPLPGILGMDLAGVVEAVGPGVTQFKRGDEVYGMVGGVGGHQGSLAQFAAVDARLLARKPLNFTMRQAAAVPLVFITAWEGLVDKAHVQAGQTVLVHGGAGGVGHIAVQLAKARGADVFATDAADKKDIIERFGATAIDYRTNSIEDYVKAHTGGEGFDIVYDTAGGPVLDASFAALKFYGHVLSSLGRGSYDLGPLSLKAGSYSGVFTLLPLLTGKGRERHGEIMREATRMAEAGQLTPLVDPRRFTLDTVEAAHTAVTDHSARGKIIVDVA